MGWKEGSKRGGYKRTLCGAEHRRDPRCQAGVEPGDGIDVFLFCFIRDGLLHHAVTRGRDSTIDRGRVPRRGWGLGRGSRQGRIASGGGDAGDSDDAGDGGDERLGVAVHGVWRSLGCGNERLVCLCKKLCVCERRRVGRGFSLKLGGIF